MAITVTPITVSTDTFETLISQVNTIIDFLGTEIVTANTQANGSITTGNTFIVGIFGSNTIAVDTALRGGNVQATGTLNIISNVAITETEYFSIGNSTINAVSNSLSLTFANSTTSTVLNKSILKIGTTTVNAVVNSTAFTLANSTVTFSLQRPTAAEVSAGNYYLASDGDWKTINADINISGTPANNELAVWVNATTVEGTSGELTFDAGTLQVGTASVNTKITSTAVTLANSTVSLQITKPTAAQISDGDYFLNANGSWSEALRLAGGTVTGNLNVNGQITPDADGLSSSFYLSSTASNPLINFDSTDYMVYDKTGNQLNTYIGGNIVHAIASTITTLKQNLYLGIGLTTETSVIEIGQGRSGDGISHIDFVSDTTYSDHGLRIIRNAGTNGTGQMIHRGTGTLSIVTNEAANIDFATTNTTRVTIDAGGNTEFRGSFHHFGTNFEGEVALNASTDRPGYISFYEGASREGYIGFSSGANSAGSGRYLKLVAENEHVGYQFDGRILQSGGYGTQTGYQDDGTKSSGTYTPSPANGNIRFVRNGGAFTLAAPTETTAFTMYINLYNDTGAGTVTLSGFEFETGDSLNTTVGKHFALMIYQINTGHQHIHIIQKN